MKEFKSNIIKEKRKLRNMSQAQLGDIIGSQAMVSRIENGQILPNAQTIFILCNKLEITVEEYFYSVFGPDQNTTIFKNNLDKLYMQGNIDELRKIFSHYKHHKSLNIETALMSRLWTGFFGTESCRTPKIFQNPDFSLKRRDFWVFL